MPLLLLFFEVLQLKCRKFSGERAGDHKPCSSPQGFQLTLILSTPEAPYCPPPAPPSFLQAALYFKSKILTACLARGPEMFLMKPLLTLHVHRDTPSSLGGHTYPCAGWDPSPGPASQVT